MKFTGFAGGCVGKALLVILCILLGVVLTLGGIALGGYIVLTKEGMVGTISDQVEKNTSVELAFDDSVKAMSVMEWGREILAAVSDMSSKEIGALEKLIGVSLISDTVEEVIGVEASVVKTSTLDKLGETVSNNLTINNAKDKFGIEFPDMPIFSDAEFLASPLATAFSDFESYTLGEVIEITEESNAVLRELKDVAIKDIGAASTDTKIKSMLLCELMTIDDDANMTLKALKYSSIESQYELDENGEIKLDEYGNPIYKTKEITEVIGGETVTNTYPLRGLNETIDALYVKDVVNITENSAVVLRKMRLPTEEEIAAGKADLFGTEDLLVNELGSAKVTEIVQNTKIGEIIDIYDADDPEAGVTKSEPILIALKDVPINGINDKLKTLALNEIFDESELESGALSLIPVDTVLNDIPSAVTAAMTNSTTATLAGKGIISEDTFTNISSLQKEQQAFIYNSNVSGMLGGVIDFIAEPIIYTYDPTGEIIMEATPNYGVVSPDEVEISVTVFDSLTEFVNAYSQYNTLNFGSAVTVNVNEAADGAFYNEETGCYLIPLFNIGSGSVNFAGGTVKTAIYETGDGGLTLSANQYGYAYSYDESVSLPEKGFATIIYG